MSAQRDAHGRYLPGAPGGPGRPRKAAEFALIEAMDKVHSPDAIVEKLSALLESEDERVRVRALELWMSYRWSKPPERMEMAATDEEGRTFSQAEIQLARELMAQKGIPPAWTPALPGEQETREVGEH